MVFKSNINNRKPFHYDTKPRLFGYAAEMRKNPTKCEDIVWEIIRAKRFENAKFRRQHPVNQFIVDFYCHELKLVIEIDGKIHLDAEQKEYDEGRQYLLESWGLTVLRLTNEQVEKDLRHALEQLKSLILELKQNTQPPDTIEI
jgi:very-short-patch-repair endonuclease